MSSTGEPREPAGIRPLHVLGGVALTAGLHVVAALAIALFCVVLETVLGNDAGAVGLIALFFVGLAQLPYMIPAWIIARKRGHEGIALGLLIGGSLTFLGNSACFGLLFTNGLNLH